MLVFTQEDISNQVPLYTHKNVLSEFNQTTSIETYLLLKKKTPTKQLADIITSLTRNPSDNHTSPNNILFSASPYFNGQRFSKAAIFRKYIFSYSVSNS